MYGEPCMAPPSDPFIQLDTSASDTFCGVRTDGTLECWTQEHLNQVFWPSLPAGTFSSVSVQGSSACAQRTDGTVECFDSTGQPWFASAVQFDAVDYGGGIHSDGSLECWGDITR
jgi:hypothetical protein